VGAHGLISVAANEIPAEMGRMIRAALSNNWAEARELERRYARLIDANFWDSNPCPVKTVLAPDGPLHGPRPPAAGSSLGRHAPGWSGWPANSAC
jgi:4-hydroxy-tetrahydrodipicolinate synthase